MNNISVYNDIMKENNEALSVHVTIYGSENTSNHTLYIWWLWRLFRSRMSRSVMFTNHSNNMNNISVYNDVMKENNKPLSCCVPMCDSESPPNHKPQTQMMNEPLSGYVPTCGSKNTLIYKPKTQ